MNREQIGKFLILRELQHKDNVGKLNEIGKDTLLMLQFDEDNLNNKDMKEVLEFIDNLEANQNQKAIKCLKEIRRLMFGTDKEGLCFGTLTWQENMEFIDNKIKELEKEDDN
jgi:hypothetical protein